MDDQEAFANFVETVSPSNPAWVRAFLLEHGAEIVTPTNEASRHNKHSFSSTLWGGYLEISLYSNPFYREPEKVDQSCEAVHLIDKRSRNGKPKDPRNNSYRSGSKKGR
ncbi:MAG: hypothetical protein PF440_01085 [Thiomicrorhabdus sp.]|jgi:hypothetical protein|nr:hypothetical protein [Thiomicrorhabdus sp.]